MKIRVLVLTSKSFFFNRGFGATNWGTVDLFWMACTERLASKVALLEGMAETRHLCSSLLRYPWSMVKYGDRYGDPELNGRELLK